MIGKNIELILEVLNQIELGLILIDENDQICFWNKFMFFHSETDESSVLGKNIFKVFPKLPKTWLKLKFKGVRQLNRTSKVSWEQRPILFDFDHGGTMLQNCSFIPLCGEMNDCMYICITIQDVSEYAKDKLELEDLIKINKSLEAISNFDSLTEIYNRRYILSALKDRVNESLVSKNKFSVLMFDLDHFKLVNDTYGHVLGDKVLKKISRLVSDNLLENSEFGRYGGEEFIIYFTGYSMEHIYEWTEKTRVKIENEKISYKENEIFVTASFGLADFTEDIKDDLEIVHNADVAMYNSKNIGRNCISIYKKS